MKKVVIFVLSVFYGMQLFSQHFPVAVNDTAYTICQVPVTVNVLQNDYDLEGDSIQICGGFVSSQWGERDISDSNLIFTPYNNTGEAIISYRVCKTNLPDYEGEGNLVVYIGENPEIPVAVDEYTTALVLDTIEIRPLLNDFDPNNETFIILDVDEEISFYQWYDYNDSIIWYSPRHNDGNIDTLSYEIIQTKENGLYSRKSEIVIQVDSNPALPVAFPDTITTYDQVPIMVFPLLNDVAPPGEELYLKYVQPSNALIERTDSTLLYFFEPDYPYNFGYSFTYRTAIKTNPYLYSSNSSVVIEVLGVDPNRPIKQTFYQDISLQGK